MGAKQRHASRRPKQQARAKDTQAGTQRAASESKGHASRRPKQEHSRVTRQPQANKSKSQATNAEDIEARRDLKNRKGPKREPKQDHKQQKAITSQQAAATDGIRDCVLVASSCRG